MSTSLIIEVLAVSSLFDVLLKTSQLLAGRPKIDSDFEHTLKTLPKGRSIDSVILFQDRLTRASKKIIDESGHEGRAEAIDVLGKQARKAQAPTLDFLDKQGKELLRQDVNVAALKQFPLLNGIVAPVNLKLAKELTKREEVVAVLKNVTVDVVEPMETDLRDIVKREANDGITWGLKRLQIPTLWAEGLTGDQVRIGHLDTGVCAEHIDLQGKIASWMAFSPQGDQLKGCPPYDTHQHGTHTAGTIVGGDASGIKIGVAPGAKLVSGMVLQGGSGSLSQIFSGIEWVMREDIHVLNLSLGIPTYLDAFDAISARLLALGIFPAFAIGNDSHGNTSSPGSSSLCCSVGAMNYDSEVTDYSGGATLSFYDEDTNSLKHTVKPDVVAPGHGVLSCVPPLTAGVDLGGHWYNYLNGTSMATPHVAGAIALLLEAVGHGKTVLDILKALFATTKHQPRGGKDNRWGFGLIDPVAAMELLQSS
jgi:serine protease AprX